MSETLTPDASPSLAGATLGGKYKLQRLIGEGGMGQVYEATNTNTRRRVAIKTLHPHLVAHTTVRQRFLQEARAATQIEHPNVIDVLDLDIDAALGIPYIVQEFLQGKTLAAHLDETDTKKLAPIDALRIAVPVMGALVAAHALGIVHRDLKPENIFLTRDRAGAEVPKVIDFGIAKVVAGSEGMTSTQYGLMLGTPSYMSPEQAMGQTPLIDAQTDVWAMGVVLYQMLSARLPYEAENANLTLGMIQYRDPTPLREREPSLDPGLVAAIDRALTKDRALRFATMQAFLGALLETSVWNSASAASAPAPTPRLSPSPATDSLTPPPPVSFSQPSATPTPSAPPSTAQPAAPVADPPPTPALERPLTIQDGWSSSTATPPPARRVPWIGLVAIGLAMASAVAGVVLSQRVESSTAAPPPMQVRPTVISPVVAPTQSAPPALPAPAQPAAFPTPTPPPPASAPVADPPVVDPPALAPPAPPQPAPGVVPVVTPTPTVATPHTPLRRPLATPRERPPRAPGHTRPQTNLDPDRDWHP